MGGTLLKLRNLNKEYLKISGWTNSIQSGMPLNASGDPIPWYTYPSIEFIKQRLTKQMNVFEYGSCNSSIWLSKKVKSLVSLEHDKDWYIKIKPSLDKLENTSYLHRELEEGAYEGEILNYKNDFDIIVIDGRNRNKCIKNAMEALKNDGIVIWDNSDRSEYEEGFNFLLDRKFKRIDFWGLGPINTYQWCTSIFYRVDNVFDI